MNKYSQTIEYEPEYSIVVRDDKNRYVSSFPATKEGIQEAEALIMVLESIRKSKKQIKE